MVDRTQSAVSKGSSINDDGEVAFQARVMNQNDSRIDSVQDYAF